MHTHFGASFPHPIPRWPAILMGSLVLITLLSRSDAQQLIHRYSFDEDARDLVGGADGELLGDAFIADGAVVLSGTKPSYVNLPNDLVVGLGSATFLTWVVWNGGPVWQRIWDFGNNDNGQDLQGTGTQSFFVTPNNGGGIHLSIFPNGIGGQQVITAPRLGTGALHQLAWTYDAPSKTGILYINGVQAGINKNMSHKLSGLGATANNWLGHSQYPDADFNGSIAEFRIYDGALSAAAIASDFKKGPDPSRRGGLVSITLAARPTMLSKGSQQLHVRADFENVSGVDITAESGVEFRVGDPDVFSVTPAGLLTAAAVSTDRTSSVQATYQGKSSTQNVRVILSAPPVLIHRYSFTSDASDSVGGAAGSLVGGAVIKDGAVVLDGVKPGYVDLPNDLVDGLTDVTLELWLTWDGGPVWQRIFDFGNNTQGEDQQGVATQSVFLTPDNGGVMNLSIFPDGIAGQQVINGTPLTPNVPHHIVWTHSAAATTSRLFVDGFEKGANTGMTYTLSGLTPLSNVWLGHSQYIQDADFAGTITEFRVYKGAMGDAEVAASPAAGPDLLASETAGLRLRVAVSGGTITLAWPVAAADFRLESTGAPGLGAVWSLVGIPPVVQGGENRVTLQNSGSARFYRLKK